ncbi:glycosyltransferase [Amycolatopsis jejuensis]|uniref:glycosyltransferase n=1 Tax=Amycolatopsis jejuensis TaxID=330084 RepID=UPI0006923410|nr:glycosyltransferase [Amycolatopsis jejuensis]
MDVVIPAHNEESSVGQAVRRLCGEPQRLRCVVVANGCSDGTAAAARAAGGDVVLDTARPGKAHALNLGDESCVTYPRAYVDADIEIDANGLLQLGAALAETGALLAVPGVRLRTEEASWLVRRYLAAWQQLPAVRANGAGRGVYVLSEAGHAETFPLPENLIADDGYVERRIGASRRVVVEDVVVTVTPVRTIRAMVRRRIRVIAGNQQLTELGLPPSTGAAGLGVLARLVRSGQVRPVDAAVFTGVSLVVRGLDAVRRARGRRVSWGTDR